MNTAEGKISSLKKFHTDFIRRAIVSGDCRAKSIPDKFKPENLPDDFEGRLVTSYGDKQHILTFSSYTDTKLNFERRINNTGLTDYEVMLYKILQWSGEAKWLVRKSEHADLLNEDARCIYKSWESLSAEMSEDEKKDIRDIVGLDTVETGGNPWSIKSNVGLFHIKRLNEIIEELEAKIKQKTPSVKKPPKTEHKPANGFMGVEQLCNHFGVKNKQAFRKRLERFRRKNTFNPNAFIEAQNRGFQQSKYLYNVAMVTDIAEQVKGRCKSLKRPSWKKRKKFRPFLPS